MSIRKCPKCGLPVGNFYSACPKCGAAIVEKGSERSAEESMRTRKERAKKLLQIGNIRIGAWELAFILVCNVAIVLVLVNAILGGVPWCHYPVYALFVAYFLAFACVSGNIRRFLTRYRNGILVTNFIAGVFQLVYRAIGCGGMEWAFDYFIPINLIAGCTIILLLLLHPDIRVRSVLFSIAILFVQNFIQLLLMAFGITADGRVSVILVTVAFGINLISLIDLIFIYLVKCRNQVVETFRFWE